MRRECEPLPRVVFVKPAGVAALVAQVSLAAVLSAGCQSAAPAAPVVTAPAAPVVPHDRKLGRIARLEDQRWLDDGAGSNVLNFLADPDVTIRRRAAIAVGRIGNDAGAAGLTAALGDPDVELRADAAFALGLLKSKAANPTLIAALADPNPLVRARTADALGLINEASGAPALTPAVTPADAVAQMAAGCAPIMAPLAPDAGDDVATPVSADADACRAALLALARMRAFDGVKAVALDAQGRPVASWWPVAYALMQVRDKRAAAPLAQLVNVDAVTVPAYALRGLAAYGDARALAPARSLATRRSANIRLRVAAIGALGTLKDAASLPTLQAVLEDPLTPPNLQVEAMTAVGTIGAPAGFNLAADRLSAKWAPLRTAAMTSAAKIDPDAFLVLISGLGRDADWTVRAALASIYAGLDPARVRNELQAMASEADPRVQGPALEALAKVGSPDLDARIAAALDAPDFNLRATAARLAGTRKAEGTAERLIAAYTRGLSDVNESARAAALSALAAFGKDAASPTLHQALTDADWSVRIRAAALLRRLGEADAQPARPAPERFAADYFESAAFLHPVYSPHAFIETRYGTIEVELNVTDAPIAAHSFTTLARKGYFNGMRVHRVVPNFVVQAGDDRGDGAGGPGYTMRDELSPLPYLRGTVGMALGGADTGGSQFFIALSPQPHLDGKYAVFGKVVRGMEIADQITRWDVIDRIRVWDGTSF